MSILFTGTALGSGESLPSPTEAGCSEERICRDEGSVGVLPTETKGPKARAITTQGAIERLSPESLAELTRFAANHLRRVGLFAEAAEDIVHSTIESVLFGADHRHAGRHPRDSDLGSESAFCVYLKGAIASRINSERNLARNRVQHISWDCALIESTPDWRGQFNQDAAAADFCRHFFALLLKRIPPRLRGVAILWEHEFLNCETIPLNGAHRRLRSELRHEAAKLLKLLKA